MTNDTKMFALQMERFANYDRKFYIHTWPNAVKMTCNASIVYKRKSLPN